MFFWVKEQLIASAVEKEVITQITKYMDEMAEFTKDCQALFKMNI